MRVNLQILCVGALLCLTACKGFTGLNPERYLFNKQTFMLNQGDPPTYVAGYIEGCSAGRRLGGDKRFVYRKNNARFEKDALYARGWQEGQINCRNEAITDVPNHASGKKNPSKQEVEDPKKAIDAERQRRVAAESRAAEVEMREIWEELKK